MEFQKNKQLQGIDPEISAYIYQLSAEFQAFSTPDTKIEVVAKDPLELQNAEALSEELPPKDVLKDMYRIGILLSDNGTNIEAEALHQNIFEAIRLAKEKLLITLNEISDELISKNDRHKEIKEALDGSDNQH